MSVSYYLPTSDRRETLAYGLALTEGTAPRRIGMLANGFPDADAFLAKQALALARFWPDAEFKIAVKASVDQLNMGIQEPLLTEMVEACDAIVIAWGHCGSCTSGIARDAVAFSERGVPSVMLVCEAFWDYSAWMGESLGVTDLPRVKLPFPIAGTGDENQKAWAARVAPEIVTALTAH